MRIEVAYARPDIQVVIALEVPAGATVADAIRRSGLLARYPEIDLGKNGIGIYGEAADLERRLRDGDRVEIYRPLLIDPKAVRRARAGNRGPTK